jgi:hypothetical protein
MSLLVGLGFREGYSDAVYQEFERLLSALKQGWSVDTLQPGMAVLWAGPTAPSGWAFAAGQRVSRLANPRLWEMAQQNTSVFGSGDGSTTFNLPDYSATGTFIIRLG